MSLLTALFVRKQPGGVYSVEDHSLTTGKRLFVHSGTGVDSLGGGRNPDKPLATLDYAVGLGTDNKGDVIYVMPGHAETIAGAAGVDVDVAGLKVIGLGWGAQRPTFTFSAAASTFAVGASSVTLENLLFVAAFTNGVVAGLDIDSSHTDVLFKNCEWRASLVTQEFLKAVTIAENAQRVTFDGCRFVEVTGGDATAAIFTESTALEIAIKNCMFYGDWSTAALDLDDDAITLGLDIWNNYCYNADVAAGLFATVTAATVGFFVGNRSGLGKANTVPVTDATASVFIDNLATDAAAISELKYPATATAWS